MRSKLNAAQVWQVYDSKYLDNKLDDTEVQLCQCLPAAPKVPECLQLSSHILFPVADSFVMLMMGASC